MSPEALVSTLEARGARLKVREDGALVISPRGVITDPEREILRARKSEVLSVLRAREGPRLCGTVSLYRLETTLVLDVPGLGGPLYITPSCQEAEVLRATAPKPCVAFCRCRIIDLILAGATKTEARAVLEAAILYDGSITELRVH